MRHRKNETGAPVARRGLGPFSGGQLTAIIMTVAVLLLLPVGAWAVSTTNVAITDAVSGTHAHVSAGSLSVAGNVAPPTLIRESRTLGLTGTMQVVTKAPSDRDMVVTDVHLDWFSNDPTFDDYFVVSVGNAGACTTISLNVPEVFDIPNTQDFRTVSFTPGYIVPAGKALCAEILDGGGTPSGLISAHSYLVGAGSVSAPLAAPVGSPAVNLHR